MEITLELVALSGVKFSDQVYEVVLPTPDGLIAVYPNHMPLVSLVSPGVISIRHREMDPDDKMELFATNGGIIEISEHSLRVLVDEADDSDEIVEQEVEAALALAQEEARKAEDAVSLDKASQLIQTQRARLQVAQMRRRKRR